MGCSCLNPEKTRVSIKMKKNLEGAEYNVLKQPSNVIDNHIHNNHNHQKEETKTNSNNIRNNRASVQQSNVEPSKVTNNRTAVNNNNINNNTNIQQPQNEQNTLQRDNNLNQNLLNQNNIPQENMNEYFDSSSSSFSSSQEDDILRRNSPFLQSKINPNFNFPEVNEIVGSGYKKMKGYICTVSKVDLEKKRNEFWSSRIEGDHTIWSILKACCETSETENIKAFMEAAGIKPYNKCLNICYDLQGAIYEIPNYCINEPFLFDEKAKDINRPEEKMLNLRLRNINTEFNLKVSNHVKIASLIETITNYIKKEDQTILAENVKLFYCGRELKREDDLWSYKINQENIIQIFIMKFKD